MKIVANLLKSQLVMVLCIVLAAVFLYHTTNANYALEVMRMITDHWIH